VEQGTRMQKPGKAPEQKRSKDLFAQPIFRYSGFRMTPRLTDEIRQAYLDFYGKKHGHAVLPSASLVPENDPTVLFTTAGMHPLVPYLMGEKHPMGKRLTDMQRCIRTGDIDEVGDASHLTFFEMLGRWSLGDYFKEGAITMSFEFLTEVLGIPLNMLAVTCFEGDKDAPKDTESAAIWKKIGIPEERIGFLPKAKNWWGPAGQTGPCGPDTEMFYWIGPTPLPPKGSNPANDDPNWLEIGNDVLLQYNKTAEGKFEPLAAPCLDEGLGLERLAKVLQKVESVYETDRMKPLCDAVLTRSDKKDNVRAMRIIVDHMKASTFMIADGVLPSNVDRGYVLRRLIRRAIRSGKMISYSGSIADMVDVIVEQYGSAHSHIAKKQAEIKDAIKKEEDQFGKTLNEGLKHFEKIAQSASGAIDGVTAFHLYDTYGFPLELTKDLAQERNLTIDEVGFAKSFEEHQNKSRAGSAQKFAGGLADHSAETTKLHTATHLLNAALHTVLGDQIQQKGSNITAERLRFDFNHPDKMTPEQIKKVEDLVNDAIKADLPISFHLTTVDGAKNEGAIGVFDDRYGSEVKVYVMGIEGKNVFSKEICGGPHVARTGLLGSFKIQKEESSSAGVRRIKAIVSGGPADIEVAKEG
jgi:alanyl-tRNA synthetase